MDRKILILVVVIAVFGFGSAAALIIPIDLQTTDTVKIYTKTKILIPTGSQSEYRDTCDLGDTVINGYIKDVEALMGTGLQTTSGQAFELLSGQQGWIMDYFSSTQDTYEGVIVCAKVVQNNIVGGFLLQPDNVALFLAYGIANAVWMAPLAIGIAAGVYLTKSKWKKSENS